MLETEIALWKPPSSVTAVEDELVTLRGVPLFKDLSNGDLKRVMKMLHVRHFAPNEVVFREGLTGAGMYIIQTGQVDVVTRLADGSELCLVSLVDRQFFGELALLESRPRTATCIVRKPSVLLGIFQSDLLNLVDRNSRLGARVILNLARLTAERLHEVSDSARARASTKAATPEPQ